MGMTKQRRLIYDIVKNADCHMTASEVYLKAKEEINNIGLGTVYRNLDCLCEQKLIRKVSMPDGPDRYDGNLMPHDHVRCISCGKLMDVKIDTGALLAGENLEGFEILGCEVQIVGLCRECAAKRRRDINE